MGNPAVIEQVSDPLVLERIDGDGLLPVLPEQQRAARCRRKEVRQAISCAIDRQELIDTALLGEGVPTGPFVEGIYTTEPFDGLPCDGPDQDMARQLLADAGYPDGFSMETIIITGENDADINIAQNLQAQLAEIGVDLELQPLETNVYVDRWLEADFDSALSENGAGPGPAPHVLPSTSRRPGNFAERRRADLAGAGRAVRRGPGRRPTPRPRVPIYQEISRILLDESPWVWLYQGYRYQVRVARARGLRAPPDRLARVVAGCHAGQSGTVAQRPEQRRAVRGAVQAAVDAGGRAGRRRPRAPPRRGGAARGVRVGERRARRQTDDARHGVRPGLADQAARRRRPSTLALVDRGLLLARRGGHDVPPGAGEVPGERGHAAPAARPHRRRDRVAAGVHRRRGRRRRCCGRSTRLGLASRARLAVRVQRPRLHHARRRARTGGRQPAPRARSPSSIFEPCGLHAHRLSPRLARATEFAVTEEGNAFERRMADWAGTRLRRLAHVVPPRRGQRRQRPLRSRRGQRPRRSVLHRRRGRDARRDVAAPRRPATAGGCSRRPRSTLATSNQMPPADARRGLGWDLFKTTRPDARRARPGRRRVLPARRHPRCRRGPPASCCRRRRSATPASPGRRSGSTPSSTIVAVLLTNATHPAVDLNKPVNALRARFANAVVAAVTEL